MTGLEFRPLGRTDIKVSSLCLGTMMYGDQINEADARAQMDVAYERGINFFDTAELYTVPPKPETQGNSERYVGQWIKDKGVRDKLILATKVAGRSRLDYLRDGGPVRVSPEQINFAIERSLKNLQTDYIDLYQIHWPDRLVPVFGADLGTYRHYPEDYESYQSILETLEALRKSGKVRHFGLSNETSYGTMKFVQTAEQENLPRMVSIQNCYNLVNRTFEYGLAEVAMAEQVGLLAYSPIAQGALTGKYLDGGKPKGSRGEMFGRLDRYETPSANDAIGAYVEVAQKFGIDPAALAMQFVTTRDWVTSNIFGANSMAQLEVIFDSLEVKWTDELNKAVNEIHAKWPNPCP